MRQIVHPIAIQIQLEARVPEIANSVDGPAIAGNIGSAGFYRVQVAMKTFSVNRLPSEFEPKRSPM